MRRLVVGIDNGINGGVVALCADTNEILDMLVMPTLPYGGKEEADILAILGRLEYVTRYEGDIVHVAIEEPLKFARSSQAVRSMALGFGKIIGALEARRIKVVRVSVKEWQDAVLGKRVPKGKTKEFALRKAKELWPEQPFLASIRSRVPHDGMVDAALIAHYSVKALLQL